MPHDKLVPSTPDQGDLASGAVSSAYGDGPGYLGDDFGPRPRARRHPVERYLAAILRRKWLLAVALVLGSAGAVGAYAFLNVVYTAQGNLWVQVEARGSGDVGPIRQSELLTSSAWIELLKTFAVLDPVVVSERLYLTVPPDYEAAFEEFALGDRFRPGKYRLKVEPDGRRWVLSTGAGAVLDSGMLGDSIGAPLGFRWRPRRGTLPPETDVRFGIVTPRDASLQLSEDLRTSMDRLGNFISLSLSGPDPEKTARILNGVMERYVELAAELKRSKLDETLGILEEQLASAAIALDVAERELEDFRVRTITLPSDAATPVNPGIQETRAPVFSSYFNMKVELEEVRRWRERLEVVASSVADEGVRVEALEAIPVVRESAEMTQVLGELVQLRTQLRALRVNFTDDYPPIQETLSRLETLESDAVPRVAAGLLVELQLRERQLEEMVESASAELAEIPSRSIEESRRRRQVAVQENIYNELRGRVGTARLAAASAIADVQILDRASVPQVPSADQRLNFAVLVLLGSLGGAMGLAILLDRLDGRVRHADDVDEDIGLDILGSIPRILPSGSKGSEDNAAQVVEAFRELRMTVAFAHGAAKPLMFAVSSPAQSEGKTLVTTNLAVAFAEMGKRTLLIDGDTRRGDAHRLMGVERSPGLSDYLRERTTAEIIRNTEYKNLDFVPCGTRGSTTPELLASHRMASFLASLKRAYDVILVDCPPVAAGADILVLAGLTGQLVVVLRTGSTDKRLAIAKMETLSRLPIRILGAVLNDVEPKGQYYKYYASYLPGYQARADDDETPAGLEGGTRLLAAAEPKGAAKED